MPGTAIITGANGSLGLAFVRAFLESNSQHTLIATVRDPSKEDSNTAKLLALKSKYPAAKVLVERLDLGSLNDVRLFASNISDRVAKGEVPLISAIVCNAFTWSLKGQKFTPDGYEATFQVSHLSHYLLVLKLLGSMDRASGRIVMLGSEAHYPERKNPISSLVAEFPGDLETLISPSADEPRLVYERGFQRYGTAKLANVMFMHDLNKRLQKHPTLSSITVAAVNPGDLGDSRAHSEQTTIMRGVFSIVGALMPVMKYFTPFRTCADAGRDLLALSLDDEFQGKRGYYVGRKPDEPSVVSLDENAQKALWEACWKWVGLSAGDTVLQETRAGA